MAARRRLSGGEESRASPTGFIGRSGSAHSRTRAITSGPSQQPPRQTRHWRPSARVQDGVRHSHHPVAPELGFRAKPAGEATAALPGDRQADSAASQAPRGPQPQARQQLLLHSRWPPGLHSPLHHHVLPEGAGVGQDSGELTRGSH